MVSRRQIRQAVVQFLYGAGLAGEGDLGALREPFWQLATESGRRAIAVAKWKTLRHFEHERAERQRVLLDRLPAALPTLRENPSHEAALRLLERVADLEQEWTENMAATARLSSDSDAYGARLEGALERLFLIDRALVAARTTLARVPEDRPELRARLEPILGALSRLDKVSARIRMLEQPERFPGRSEIQKIRDSVGDQKELQEAANSLLEAIWKNQSEIDEALAGVIENYAPERVNAIDQAVLRLAAWEILFESGVPRAVAINEAVELAREFGGADSARFVNGVLDRVGRA